MDVHDFVKSQKTTNDECITLARTMYERYVAEDKAGGYVPRPIEEFLFFPLTCFSWPIGAIVRIKGKADNRAYLVKGYDRHKDVVILTQNYYASATELEPADIPEDILEVARQQIEAKMAEKCPLKDGAPCLA